MRILTILTSEKLKALLHLLGIGSISCQFKDILGCGYAAIGCVIMHYLMSDLELHKLLLGGRCITQILIEGEWGYWWFWGWWWRWLWGELILQSIYRRKFVMCQRAHTGLTITRNCNSGFAGHIRTKTDGELVSIDLLNSHVKRTSIKDTETAPIEMSSGRIIIVPIFLIYSIFNAIPDIVLWVWKGPADETWANFDSRNDSFFFF